MSGRATCFLFFALTIFISVPLLGQNLGTIDSLHRLLNRTPEADQFELLNAIGFEYRYSYPDSTIYYCRQAYDLGNQIELSKDLAKPLSFLGLAYGAKGDYQKSSEYHNQSIKVALAQQDSIQLAFGYNNLGRMFFDGGDIVRALNSFIQAKNIFESVQEKSGLAYVYRSLADIHKSQGNYEQAIEMSTSAYELRKQLLEKRAIISSLFELGLIYELMNDNTMALRKLRMADSIAHRINDRATLTELKLATAEILLSENNYDEAYKLANEVMIPAAEVTNQKLSMQAAFIIGNYFIAKNQHEKARPVFEDLIEKARLAGNLVNQIDAMKYAALCYQVTGNNKKALSLRAEASVLQNQIKNTELQRQIERLQFQLHIEKQERENELLKVAQVRSDSLISMQRFQNKVLLFATAGISVLMTVLLIFNRKRKRINKKLREQNERILKQQAEISDANTSLRKQNQQLNDLNNEKNSLMNIVAHDLKSPLNRIDGLIRIIDLEGGLPAKQQEYLKMIQSATKSGANMIVDLLDVNSFEQNKNAPVASSFDIGLLLEESVNSFSVSASIKSIELSVRHIFSSPFVSDPNFINRIIENLISNAIKFSSRCSEISVTGRMVGTMAVISVKDQGQGFSEADRLQLYQKFKRLSAQPTGGEASNGLGLAIVKTLVDRLDGIIELISVPGKGAEFIVKIPAMKNN